MHCGTNPRHSHSCHSCPFVGKSPIVFCPRIDTNSTNRRSPAGRNIEGQKILAVEFTNFRNTNRHLSPLIRVSEYDRID
jgi:hypothetical protein